MENFDLKKYLAENKLLKEEIDVNKILSDGGYDIIDDEELLMTVKSRLKGKSNIDAEKLNLLVMKIEDEEGGNIDFTENKLLKEELRDVEDILVKAGFRFDDGLLGGVGSGGAGYYDMANDKIYGYNQAGPWNEEEFSKFYDNFEFNSSLYDSEDLEDLEISQPQLGKGIYAVGDDGYVQIYSNGDVEIYATPQLAAEDDSKFLPAFKMDASGRAIPLFSKDEMRKMLKDDMMYIL